MKVLVFAHGDVGLNIVEYLQESFPTDILSIVTLEYCAIQDYCRHKKIPAILYTTEQDLIDKMEERPSLGFLVWWPKIIRRQLIDYPFYGFINTHPSYLPYNRGKHYSFWALVERAPFGVSLHKVDESIDAGALVSQRRIEYDWTDTGESLYTKAKSEMRRLFAESYPILRTGQFTEVQQDLAAGSFHFGHEIDVKSRIDLKRSYTGEEMLNLLRARTFTGRPACWFESDGVKYEAAIRITRVDNE